MLTGLDEKDSYAAMFVFLEKHYEVTQSPDVGGLLGVMRLLEDGTPVDPAMWSDWLEAIRTVRDPR